MLWLIDANTHRWQAAEKPGGVENSMPTRMSSPPGAPVLPFATTTSFFCRKKRWHTLKDIDMAIRWHTSTWWRPAAGNPWPPPPPCAGCSSELGPWFTGESGIWNLDNFEQYPGRTGLDLNVFITSLAARAYDFHVFIHGCDVLIVLWVQCPYSYGVVTLSIMWWCVRICLSDSVCVMKTLPGIRVRACCSYHISWTSREVSFTWVACHSHAAETMFWHAKVTSLWHSLWISFYPIGSSEMMLNIEHCGWDRETQWS